MIENHMVLPYADDEPTILDWDLVEKDWDSINREAEIADSIENTLRDMFGPTYLEPGALLRRQAD